MTLTESTTTMPDCGAHGNVPLLPVERIAEQLQRLEGWQIGDKRLTKTYQFRDRGGALAFLNRVCAVAELQNHHPELYLWKREVRVDLWTHKSDGLTEKDFVFAAVCDPLAHR